MMVDVGATGSTLQAAYVASAGADPSITTTAALDSVSIGGTIDDVVAGGMFTVTAPTHTVPTATTAIAVTGTPNGSGSLVSITDTSTESGNALFVNNSGDGPGVIIQNTSSGNAFRVTDGITNHFTINDSGSATFIPDSNGDFTVTTSGASGIIDLNAGAGGLDIDVTAGPITIDNTGAFNISITSGQQFLLTAADEVDITSDCVGIHPNSGAEDTSSFHSEMERFQLWGTTATTANGSFVGMNTQRVSTTAKEAGTWAVLSTSATVTDTITATTAAVAVTTDAEVTVASSTGFAVGDLVTITGSASECNDDVYEVASIPDATHIRLRGPNGVTARSLTFTGLDLVTAGAGGTIQKATVSVIQTGIDGLWEGGTGDDDTITFTNFQGATTLQQAYVNGETITVSAGEGALEFIGTADDATTVLTLTGGDHTGGTAGNILNISNDVSALGDAVFINNVGGGSAIEVQDGGSAVMDITGGGAVVFTPTSGANFTVDTAGAGAISLDATAASNFTTSSGDLTVSATAADLVGSGVNVNLASHAAVAPGDITLTGGVSTSGGNTGGEIFLNAGDGSTTGAGGGLTGTGGDGGATSGIGGPVSFTGGLGVATSAGGLVAIAAGDGGATDTSTGGAVTISSGTSTATNGNGGAFTLSAGDGPGTGSGGAMSISAGDSLAGASGTGGAATFSSGSGGTNGSGGDLTIDAGDGGTVTGPAGRVDVRGGDSVNLSAGTVNLIGGASTSGTAGHINVTAGSGGTGNGGQVRITAGEGDTTSGWVRVQNASDANISETSQIATFENQGSGTGGGALISFYTEDLATGSGVPPTHSAHSGSLYWQQSAGAAVLYMNTSTGETGSTWSQVQTGTDAVDTWANVLSTGAVSGGTDPEISATDTLRGVDGVTGSVLNMRGGSGTAGIGGEAILRGGAGAGGNFAGGDVSLFGGLGAGTSAGGDASLVAGTGGATAGTGGDTYVLGGSAGAGGVDGNINIGTATTTKTTIEAGSTAADAIRVLVTGDGGGIDIDAGTATSAGVGGDVNVDAGAGFGPGDAGGTIGLRGGVGGPGGGGAGGVGGSNNLIGGAGGSGTGAAGGGVFVRGGNAGGTNANGGDGHLGVGSGTGTGSAGELHIGDNVSGTTALNTFIAASTQIDITSTGTAADAIDINSSGGLDIDAAGAVSIVSSGSTIDTLSEGATTFTTEALSAATGALQFATGNVTGAFAAGDFAVNLGDVTGSGTGGGFNVSGGNSSAGIGGTLAFVAGDGSTVDGAVTLATGTGATTGADVGISASQDVTATATRDILLTSDVAEFDVNTQNTGHWHDRADFHYYGDTNRGDNYAGFNMAYADSTTTTHGHYGIRTSATVLNGTITASTTGVAAGAQPSFTTSGITSLAAGTIILVEGASPNELNGLYEVNDGTTTTLTLRGRNGIGTVATNEEFLKGQVNTYASASGTIYTATICVMRCNTSGGWEVADGSAAPLTYTALSTAGGVSLDQAYTNGEIITIEAAEGTFLVQNTDNETINMMEVTHTATSLDVQNLLVLTTSDAFSGGEALTVAHAGVGDGIAVDTTGTGNALNIMDGGTTIALFTGGGAIDFDPTAGADFTVDATGAGIISLDAAAASNFTVTGASADLTLSTGNTTVAGDVVVLAGDSATATTVGGGISITGGGGATTGAGGLVAVTGGISGGTDASVGGAVTIDGGTSAATNGDGGAVTVTGGLATGTGSNGGVNLAAPDAEIDISATGTTGTVDINSGSHTTITSTFGNVNIDATGSGNFTVTGGDLTLSTGNTGAASDVLVFAGDSSTATTVGGAVAVTAGDGATTGAGGAVTITGGIAGNTDTSIGGAVNITSGTSAATNGSSGAINIEAGAETGTGSEGDISIGAVNAGTMLIGITSIGTTVADSLSLGSQAGISAIADTTITLTTSDIADASGSDISVNAASSTAGTADGASIRLLPGDGFTTGAHGSVDIDGAFDADEAFLTLTGSGAGGNSDLYAGSTLPAHTAVAGSLYFRNDAMTATGGRLYVQVDASGASDDGSTWEQLESSGAALTRQHFQTTMSADVLPMDTIQSVDIVGTLPTKPASNFTFNTDAEIYLNGILLYNGVDIADGASDDLDIPMNGSTFRDGDVITIIYHQNSTAG
jgi:hypothetical protein